MRRLIIDLDGTLTKNDNKDYKDVSPKEEVVSALKRYKADGFEVVIMTSRNVRTYQNNVGKIIANTVPVIMEWCKRHEIPYDEIWVGKPWCGYDGFYVDDRSIRPSEFAEMSYAEVQRLIGA